MEVFTNLETNEVLDFSNSTMVQSAEGIFGIFKNREYAADVFGGSIPLSSSLSQKIFTLIFQSGDFTGEDQMKIARFFGNSDGFFRMTADYLGTNFIDFTVASIEPHAFNGESSLDITCQAKYGDFINENNITLYEATIGTGYSTTMPTFSQSFANGFSTPAEIVLTMETLTSTSWKPNISIILRKGSASTGQIVQTSSGAFNDSGSIVAWDGVKYEINSWKGITEGKGFISPNVTTFWRLAPGETATIAIPTFTRPVSSSSTTFNVKIQARSIQQKNIF